MNSGSCEDKLSDKRRNYCELRRSQDARDRRDQSDVIRKVTARRRARRKITARRRARSSAKCKAENEMQEQNARAGGRESNKAVVRVGFACAPICRERRREANYARSRSASPLPVNRRASKPHPHTCELHKNAAARCASPPPSPPQNPNPAPPHTKCLLLLLRSLRQPAFSTSASHPPPPPKKHCNASTNKNWPIGSRGSAAQLRLHCGRWRGDGGCLGACRPVCRAARTSR
jgi:hypothetical protein